MTISRRNFFLHLGAAALAPSFSEGPTSDPMTGYHRFDFTQGDIAHPVYRRGDGPGVLLMHELPGMTAECLSLAERIRKRGFRVYLPLFFGEPGVKSGTLRVFTICLRREFSCLASEQSSPITTWLRTLIARIANECGSKVGVIGMCFTGNFVFSLMIDPQVSAPITCQPALPVFAFTAAGKSALTLAPGELAAARQRAAAGVTLLGFRFPEDWICAKERFDRLRREFGPAFQPVEIDSSPNNFYKIDKGAHAVFTEQFVDRPDHPTYRALETALTFLEKQLKQSIGSS